MPIYVYEPTIYSEQEQVNDCCSFEILQSINEKSLIKCPTCSHAIHRAVAPFFAREGLFENKSLGENKVSSSSPSMARNAASLAARHLCSSGCKH